ncbi:GroES-like protein [Astrocystis sublimbata]|nr:GroES-like protein [Astrocystis sublimbata]
MRAVVLKGVRQVTVEERPVPRIQDPTDIVVKVRYTALCGSELHVYRGHQPSATDFVMGHEFTGTVSEAGAAVTSVRLGDAVVCPFTTSCGACFYCLRNLSSRCAESQLFGSAVLDGAQAQYVRVPLADSTVVKAPVDGETPIHVIDEAKLCLMADILPTGYFAAKNALEAEETGEATVVVIGCGPVGLCALVAAREYAPKYLVAVDGVEERLGRARALGAEAWDYKGEGEGLVKRIKELTDGRGADVVIEVVGHSSALDTAFRLLRPGGTISSVGVHNGEIPWNGREAYNKNLKIQMGRCPVRSIFPEALKLLEKQQHVFGFMTENIMPLTQAVRGYELFDAMKVQKVIFDAEK